MPCPQGMWIGPKCHVPATCAAHLQTVSLGIVRPPLGIGSGRFHVSLPASARSQLCVGSIAMLLSYERPQLGVEWHDQTNGGASKGVIGTPGPVIGRPPQRGRPWLEEALRPS